MSLYDGDIIYGPHACKMTKMKKFWKKYFDRLCKELMGYEFNNFLINFYKNGSYTIGPH